MSLITRSMAKSRILASRLSSLLLLFQRTPVIQVFFPEARLLSSAGVGEITTWAVATVIGLGAYDSVAGATTISQILPSTGSTTVPATSGTALSFIYQVTGAPGTAGSWSITGNLPNGLVHTGAKNNSINSITGVPTQTGSFQITVKAWENSNFSGGSSSETFTINVVAGASNPPTIETQPASVTINSGNTTTLTVAASGSPSPTFQWYIGSSGVTNNPISGATSASFTTPALTSNTNYWVRATNSEGREDSATTTVNVRIPPAITSQPTSTTINSGGTATLTVAASGSSPNFQWYRGTVGNTTNPVSGATSASFQTPALTATTTYWVRASNAAGNANSNAATVTVRIPPTITTQPVSTAINGGETTTFTVAASGTSPTFQWYLGSAPNTSNPVAEATTNTFTTPNLAATASFWVRASNAAGNADSNTVTATVLIPPAITTQPVSTTINSGSTTTLTVAASGTPSTFQWYVGATGDTSQPINGASQETFTTPPLTENASYWVRATNVRGSADSDTAVITVIFAPAITSPPASITITSGGTTTFTVATSGTSPIFQWYLGNSPDTANPVSGATTHTFTTPALTSSTSYWVRASNAAGNADSATVTATILGAPVITTQPLSTTLNSGGTVTLAVAASGSFPTFQWYIGEAGDTSQPIDGATLETFTTPVLTTSARYWVRAFNSVSFANSDTASITIILAPIITTPPASATVNSGGTATFTVAASGTSPTFQWYLGNATDTSNPLLGAITDTFTTGALTADATYWVRASNTAGTADSATVTATVTATVITPPQLTSQPASAIIAQGKQATLTVTASGTAPTFQWYLGNTGDTSQPVAEATTASFITPTITATTGYWVRVTNAAGTADSQTVIVTVLMPPAIKKQPASVAVKLGKRATLKVGVTGSSLKYQWYQGKAGVTTKPVLGAKSATFITPAIKAPTRYWVRITNSVGRVNSKTAVVTVLKATALKTANVQPAAVVVVEDPYTTWITGQLDAAQLTDEDFTAPSADPDGDGVSNENEYLFGHDPLSAEPAPMPETVVTGNQLSLGFTARQAKGPGYHGLTRLYTLEVADTPDAATWTALTGYSDIAGNGQTVTYITSEVGARQFYRISARLAP